MHFVRQRQEPRPLTLRDHMLAPVGQLSINHARLGLMSPPMREFLFDSAFHAFDETKRPLVFAFIGWGLGVLGRAILK